MELKINPPQRTDNSAELRKIMALREQASDARRGLESTLGKITNDNTRTQAWKTEEMGNAYRGARETIESLREQEAAVLERRERALLRKLTGTGATYDPLAVIPLRDAQDRADAIEDERQAERLMARATTSGDRTLALALAQRASKEGWASTFDSFAKEYPADANDANNLSEINAMQTSLEHKLAASAAYAVPSAPAGVWAF